MIESPGSSQGRGWRLNRRQFLEAAALAGLSLRFRTQAAGAAGQGPPTREGAVYLTDLDRCRPASALSTRLKRGTWKTLEYETDDFGGTMLVALEESAAPDLTYALNRSGWHRIYVGIYRKPFEQPKQIQVKLSGDPAYTTVTGRRGETDHRENWIDDIYWKSADLSGRDLLIRQTRIPRTRHGWLAYIKLVPLSAPEVESLRRDRAQRVDQAPLRAHRRPLFQCFRLGRGGAQVPGASAAYPIDGVGVLYNRRPPLVAYEEPLVREFQARYGQDPRRLDERDPRWLTFRSRALTRFMRELRQAMDEVAQQSNRSRRLAISAVVFRPEENLLHGMDLKTWISEGLVDRINPGSRPNPARRVPVPPPWQRPAGPRPPPRPGGGPR